MRVIAVAEYNKRRPSEILSIDNDWYAFCIDEALAYIGMKSKDKDAVMVWDNSGTVVENGKEVPRTISPGEFYKQFQQ